MKITDRVISIVAPIVEGFGYELYDVEYKKEGGEYMLDIIIDSENGIDLCDCEKVSREVDDLIEENNIIDNAYCLCVSSPGLDRELKKEKDYEKNIGKEVDIRLYKSFEGKSKHIGILKSYNDDNITIFVKNKTITIPRDIVSVIKQYVSI